VAAPHAEHLAVTDLAHVSGPLRRGATARYRVAVSNPGAEARKLGVTAPSSPRG